MPIKKLSQREINLIRFALRAFLADFTFTPQPLQSELDLDVVSQEEVEKLIYVIDEMGHIHLWRRG